jgi:hypothetical protein
VQSQSLQNSPIQTPEKLADMYKYYNGCGSKVQFPINLASFKLEVLCIKAYLLVRGYTCNVVMFCLLKLNLSTSGTYKIHAFYIISALRFYSSHFNIIIPYKEIGKKIIVSMLL